MNIANLGYFYYKEYYDEYFKAKYNQNNDISKINDSDKRLFNEIEFNDKYKIEDIGKQKMFFKTTYPGVLLGSGLLHSIGAKKNDNEKDIQESKLGFDFDYTTGLPILRGSSIKGLLRNVFDLLEVEEKRNGVIEYLKSILIGIDFKSEMDEEFFNDLKFEIFEGVFDGKKLPMQKRDVFYDATIEWKDKKSILGEDYITPHDVVKSKKSDGMDKLKNPVPIKFVKLMPDITIKFEFDLKETTLNIEQKLKLFKQIILDFGIGAKTNVGYGYLKVDEQRERE